MDTVELDAYVLPTIGSYTAYVDTDIDEYAKQHGMHSTKIKINLYSPEKLSEGELIEVSSVLDEEWGRYLCRLEFSKETFRWLKWMALVEGSLIAGLVTADFSPVFPETGLLIYYRVIIDIFFWGSLIFGPVTIAGIRVLTHYGREKRASKLVNNWKGTITVEGSNSEKHKMVRRIHEYWSTLEGREIAIYKKMRDYCKSQGYETPYNFYKLKVDDLEKGRSFHLKYRPPSFKGKLRNIFLGPKIESPKIQAPMRMMKVEGKGNR